MKEELSGSRLLSLFHLKSVKYIEGSLNNCLRRELHELATCRKNGESTAAQRLEDSDLEMMLGFQSRTAFEKWNVMQSRRWGKAGGRERMNDFTGLGAGEDLSPERELQSRWKGGRAQQFGERESGE
ncbi:Uncharacterized protein Fot_39463 [Forsythia ovata]|uniref:Uncharacterized protein n=1 Tax=Forsythia ovata TaxID=205694 RepID=A0ABD1S5E2_9LAMI